MSFPNSREWISVCYGNGKFVSISQSENIIAYSTDGITWTEVAIPASSVYWFMIKFGGGVFAAVGLQGNDIIYSADGVNWSLQALPEDQSAMQMFVDLSFGENKYIALAVTGSIAIFPLALKSFQEINTELNTLASTVGENRQFIESQAVEIKDIRETITIENLQEWDITYCGKSNSWHSVAYGENKIIVAGYTTKVVLYSDDNGINWNIAELPYEADWTGIVYGANKFVILGQHNTTALYSADGIHWTPTNPLSEEDENNWTCLNYVGDKFLAYNSINNRIAYSTDGISWNSAIITENFSFKKIAYGNGIYVSMDNYKDYVLTSSDGIEWVKKQIPMSASWCDIAYGGDGKFVMISLGRDIIYSVDGSNWQKADTQLDMERITSGTSDSGTDIFVSVGNNKAWKSADGITWDEFSIESLAGPLDITYINPGTYVTVDDDNIIVLSVSDELINGTSQDVPKINEWSSITYGDGKFVIVANNGYYCATTTDPSANWDYYNMPRLQNWTSVTYGDGKFVAVAQGSDKGAYSTDGITWTEMSLPSDDKWKAITFGWNYEDPVFIAVADDSSDSATYSVARSNDGIEWEGDTLPFKSNWSNIAHAYFEETKENVFVAISSSSSKTVYSPDGGYYWKDTYNQLPSDATFRALAGGGGGKIWAIQYGGNKAVYMSNNRSWTTITMPSSQNWTSIVYGNGKYIALASDSNTLAINPESSEEWKEITASKAPTDTSMPGIYGNGKFVFINSSISTATSKTKKLGDVLTQIWISTLS